MSDTEKNQILSNQNAEKIDLSTWARRDIFNFFSTFSEPFYTVIFCQDVTKLYKYVKANRLSFYYSMCYLCTKAINAVEAFHYVIRGGEVYRIAERTAKIVDIKKDTENFIFVHVPLTENMETYSRSCRERCESQTVFFEPDDFNDMRIFFTCAPDLDMAGFTNPHNLNIPNATDDSTPRIGWGKYKLVGDRVEISICFDVNHRLIDGSHIGAFAKKLTELIEALDISEE